MFKSHVTAGPNNHREESLMSACDFLDCGSPPDEESSSSKLLFWKVRVQPSGIVKKRPSNMQYHDSSALLGIQETPNLEGLHGMVPSNSEADIRSLLQVSTTYELADFIVEGGTSNPTPP